MKLEGYSSLTDMVRKAPINPETVQTFRDQALQAVDQAIDVFFKPEREVAEGKAAYDDLTDVERALRAFQTRNQKEFTELAQQSEKLAASTSHPKGQEEVGATPSLIKDGKPLNNGIREYGRVYKDVERLGDLSQPQSRIEKLANTMGQILPLYGSVAMVPGPLSVSLKDHLKQTMEWNSQSSSSGRSTVERDSIRLLTLSAGKKRIVTSSGSESSSSGKAETVTIDERVMPGLHQMRSELSGLGYVAPRDAAYKFTQGVTEFDRFKVTEGALWWSKEVDQVRQVNEGSVEVAQGQVPLLPARMALGAQLHNAGLSKPGAGAELIDMVNNQSELQQDFVDGFRDKALGVLDKAVETLFNPAREVEQGRQRYDELANLQRALKLAQAKFGQESYYSALPNQIENLDKVVPLYACVAMVPGEMSSSVKNYDKELFESRQQSSSWSQTQGREWNASLLTLGGSETVTNESHGSQSSSSAKFETTTTDERIMPALHQLRIKLDQLQISTNRDKASLLIPVEKSR